MLRRAQSKSFNMDKLIKDPDPEWSASARKTLNEIAKKYGKDGRRLQTGAINATTLISLIVLGLFIYLVLILIQSLFDLTILTGISIGAKL